MQGAFVTGTDTGAGKTVVAMCIVAALRARGLRVAAVKPAVTGLDEPEPGRPADHELLAAAAGVAPEAVTTETYGPPVSPHLAAALAGRPLDPRALVASARASAESTDAVIAEGAGGLLVPLTDSYLIRDYARDLGLPIVIASRPGLGTINHTLLTLEAARSAGLTVLGVVMTPWPAACDGTLEPRDDRAPRQRPRRRAAAPRARGRRVRGGRPAAARDRARGAYARSPASSGISRDGVNTPATS
jgi:dethiobiotin synthetase